jgi:hypothetical protein
LATTHKSENNKNRIETILRGLLDHVTEEIFRQFTADDLRTDPVRLFALALARINLDLIDGWIQDRYTERRFFAVESGGGEVRKWGRAVS